MKFIFKISILFFVVPLNFLAQPYFELNLFLKIVKTNHPVIKQCDIILENADQKLTKAKGAYDPVISSSINKKEINDNLYYNLFEGNLKVPIWSGIEIQSGYNRNSGSFLNPENYLEANNLWYTGISIPIGRNLLMDVRLSEIKKSKELIKLSLQEVRIVKNNLIFQALKQYWLWVEKYNDFKIYEEFVELSYNRFLAVKEGFLSGDLASIDSLESFVMYQSRLYKKSQYEKEYINETIKLSNYLWLENNIPLELTDQLNPPHYSILLNHPDLHVDTNQNSINTILDNHPSILLIDKNVEIQKINKRLAKENLKPQLDLKYNFLNQEKTINQYNFNNYKMGVNFSYSLFLRKERSQIGLVNLKLRDLEYDRFLKKQSLLNTTKNFINELVFTENQADIFEEITKNYASLLNGEKLKFEAGESSIFLLNTRESKLIESKLTLVQLKVRAIVNDYGIDWSLGILDK